MHVQAAPHFQDVREAQLLRLVGRLRWRLGFERALLHAIRGVIACSIALIGLSSAAWLSGKQDVVVWLAVAPAVVALGVAIARWPSRRAAALAADRRLGLDERLATAVELLDSRSTGRFAALQIRDAALRGASGPGAWLVLDRRLREQALLAASVAVLAAASLVLPGLPRPAALSGESSPAALDAPLPADLAMRTLPDAASDAQSAGAQPIQGAESTTDLASRVQQAQAERSALDTLAKALGSVSAGQRAADALQQGDYSSARDQLRALAEETDQLSDAAKQQLARALQQAASATTQTDRQLADKERQAAQALKGSTYADQRSALRGLADQVEKSGTRSVPTDQLQRDLGLLQQQQRGSASAGSAGTSSSSGQQSAGASTSIDQQSPGAGATAAGTSAVGSGDSGALGQPGGAGVGTASDPNVFGDPSRLDTAGQTVQVPMKLSGGPGSRPADGSEDQTASDLSVGSRNVGELSQSQRTGQVAPEQNLVPGEQRPVVRGYFR